MIVIQTVILYQQSGDKMYFTLDRIENKSVAVLTDDNGKTYDVSTSLLPQEKDPGCVYNYDGSSYIYNEKETVSRRNSNSEKLNKLINKAKNRK